MKHYEKRKRGNDEEKKCFSKLNEICQICRFSFHFSFSFNFPAFCFVFILKCCLISGIELYTHKGHKVDEKVFTIWG